MRMPRLSDYGDARELFRATRDAAIDAERIRGILDRMEASDGVRGASLSGRVSSGGASDPMARTDARIDYEERVRERQDADYALLDIACEVIYGRDPRGGGIAALMGAPVADAMWWRYCAAAKWRVVEARVGMTERWCRDACERAMDQVDAYGPERVASGLGIAEG